jgi:hypothetical protein
VNTVGARSSPGDGETVVATSSSATVARVELRQLALDKKEVGECEGGARALLEKEEEGEKGRRGWGIAHFKHVWRGQRRGAESQRWVPHDQLGRGAPVHCHLQIARSGWLWPDSDGSRRRYAHVHCGRSRDNRGGDWQAGPSYSVG